MNSTLTIFHGSEKIIKEPCFGVGRKNNDFGLGFYCTENEDLAKEWAVSQLSDGFANKYALDKSNLRILNLNSPDYTILNWIAVLLEHRIFTIKTPLARKAKAYLIDNFGVNVNAYDIITGYRADDSYFDYAENFLNNGISVDQLAKAMNFGKLGEQIVIKSKYAFSKLIFQDFSNADSKTYYTQRVHRNENANKAYLKLLEEIDDGLYVRDIVKGGVTNNDPRIPRNISK